MTIGEDPGQQGLPRSPGTSSPEQPNARSSRLQERLAVPVLLAALASVPAVFLTLLDGPARTAGTLVNTLSGAVIVAEVVVLFAVSDDKLRWVRQNPGRVALGLVVVAAVVFTVGPLQLLRLTKTVGALRILRAGKLITAGRILRQRAGLEDAWQRVVGVGLALLAAVFVALVLSDPTSQSRRVLDGALHWLGVTGVVLAGAVLAIATYVLHTARRERERVRHQAEPGGQRCSSK